MGNVDSIKGTLLDCLVELTIIYERKMTKEALVSGLPLRGQELTPEFFQRAAERANFLSKAYDLPFEDINVRILPCIVALHDHQYCLLLAVENKTAKIFTEGKLEEIPLADLQLQYANQVILVKPKNIGAEEAEEAAPFRIRNVKW